MYAELNKITNMVRITYGNINRKEHPEAIKIKAISEFLKIYKSTPNWYKLDNSDDIYAPYFGNLKTEYNYLLAKRIREYNTIGNIDTTKKFPMPNDGGNYKLIYQPKNGNIFIAYRKNNEKISKYCIGISNELSREFQQDCKSTPYFNKYHKYRIWESETEELFHKWAAIIQSIYVKEYMKNS